MESDNQSNMISDSLNQNQTEISSTSSSISYKGSYKVVLKDVNSSKPIFNRTINFIINNVNYTAATDSNGVAGIKLDLNIGKYEINAYFRGDDEYLNSSLSADFEIKSPIKANDITKYYKSSAPFTSQFYTPDGNFLANTLVTITVNAKSYRIKTNTNGIASLPVNLKPGSYKIISQDPVTGFKLKNTFTVLSTITSSKLKTVEGEKFTAKFLKSTGKCLVKKYIKIKFKGKKYKIKTDSRGFASLSLKNVKKGTYKIVCYNRDGLTKTFNVKVYKRKASTTLSANSYTFYPADKKIIKVKLSTALDDSSNSGKTLKIKIGSKTFSKKTDSSGTVALDLSSFKKGIYKVKYSYGGNKYFKSSKSTKSLTIFDTTKTSLKVVSTTHFGYGAGTLFKVAYTAGGIPLAKKTVKLNIAGQSYIKTTDSNGIVSVAINLKIGTYNATYRSDGDSIFTGTSGSSDFDVFQRSPSKVIWKCENTFKDNSQTFRVLVVNHKNQHISGGEIELTIDGRTYTATVDSSGYAKFKSDVAIGKYNVKISFKGNNNYLSSSASKNVNVKLSKFAKGLNEKHAKALKSYIKSSSHCKVGSKAIKKLVKSLTKGLTSKTDKAKAIFNFVRDNLDYAYYYNTKYGASKTLKYKRGNCADHSHLLVAMFRTAGFHARYVHGRCHFSDGDVTGHVWTQVKIGGKWVVADAVSYRNSLGKIKNWNTKSYHVHGKYASLPF